MRTGSKFLSAMFGGWCAIVGCVSMVHGQCWQPVLYAGTLSRLATTNGVTFVEISWTMGGCLAEESIGPFSHNGTNFSFNLDIEDNICGPCPQIVWIERTNIVLGALTPGTYTLTMTSWYMPVRTYTFTIAPVLQANGFDTNGYFQIQMSSGVTNVNYLLQSSTDFVSWSSISTNTVSTNAVGVALTDYGPVLPGMRLYRVLCQ